MYSGKKKKKILTKKCGDPTSNQIRAVSLAKQDLSAGRTLDGIGGAACYGQVDTVVDANSLLPIGISEHATLLRDVRRDEPVHLDDVEIDENAYIVKVRAEQDRLVADDSRSCISPGVT